MGRARLLVGISLFWLGLSVLSDGMATLVLPQHLSQFAPEATRATTLGLLSFVGILAGMLLQPLAGAWSDRLRPRWGRRGALVAGALLILLALAAFALSRGVLAILLAFTLVQLALSVAQAPQQGFIPDLVPAGMRGTAAGLKGFMDVGGALLAFILLGSALEGGALAPALSIIAAILGVTLLATLLLVREPRDSVPPPPRLSWAALFRVDTSQHRAFIVLVLSRFLFLLGTYGAGRFLLYFVADRLGTDPTSASAETGMLLAALTLVTVVAAPPAGWAADRVGRLPLMRFGALINALGLLLLAVASQPWQILLFGVMMAIGSAAFTGANWALTADLVPRAESARFMALANFGTAGAAAAAGLLGPLVDGANALAPGAGYTTLFVAAGLLSAASLIALRPLSTVETPVAVPQAAAEV